MRPWPSVTAPVSALAHPSVCWRRPPRGGAHNPLWSPATAEADSPALQQAFLGLAATSEPWGAVLPQGPEERRKLGEVTSWGGCWGCRGGLSAPSFVSRLFRAYLVSQLGRDGRHLASWMSPAWGLTAKLGG